MTHTKDKHFLSMPFQVGSLPQASPHLRLPKILLPACTAVENRAKTKIRTQWVVRMQPDLPLALKVWKLGTVPIKMPVLHQPELSGSMSPRDG